MNATVSGITAVWDILADNLSTEEERIFSSTQLADLAGKDKRIKATSLVNYVGRAMRFFKGLGILSYYSTYETAGRGQTIHMKLLANREDGKLAIYKHFDSGLPFGHFEVRKPPIRGEAPRTEPVVSDGGRPDAPYPPVSTNKTGSAHGNYKGDAAAHRSRVVVADERSPEETRAIAGPEPESPMRQLVAVRKDEEQALIAAARQYANRGDAVHAKIKELAALGISVDEAKLAEAIHLEVDERLETIAAILPYIDRLERTNERLTATSTGDRSELIELRREASVLRKEVNDLRAANRRLSERNVALAAQAKTPTAEVARA